MTTGAGHDFRGGIRAVSHGDLEKHSPRQRSEQVQRSWGREELHVHRRNYLLDAFPGREKHCLVSPAANGLSCRLLSNL